MEYEYSTLLETSVNNVTENLIYIKYRFKSHNLDSNSNNNLIFTLCDIISHLLISTVFIHILLTHNLAA